MADTKEHIPIGEYFDRIANDDHTDIVRSMCRFNYNMGKITGTIKTTIFTILILPASILFIISPLVGGIFVIGVIIAHIFAEKYIESAVLKLFIPMLSSKTTKQMYNEMLDFVEIFKAVE